MRSYHTRRFLELPALDQVAIAETLGVRTDDDKSPSEESITYVVFNRAGARDKHAQLWDEIEKRYPDPADYNPFRA